ncbi:hypothetical protein [Ruegeria atlantica]|uniref:hypothetical protein n=1 Tax=Ruegeria atlantica TaxID=81569 RepID=UPI00147E4603|nr:hypothetical protein [Ruegeria atlantica]
MKEIGLKPLNLQNAANFSQKRAGMQAQLQRQLWFCCQRPKVQMLGAFSVLAVDPRITDTNASISTKEATGNLEKPHTSVAKTDGAAEAVGVEKSTDANKHWILAPSVQGIGLHGAD